MDVPFFQRCLIFFSPTSRLLSPYRGLHIVLRVVLFLWIGAIGDAMAETAAGTPSQDLEHVALRHKGIS